MRHELLCLNQLHDFIVNLDTVDKCNFPNDLVVYHLYASRKHLSSTSLREVVYHFVSLGFNPFSPKLSDVAKIQMKSIISKCDYCL